MPGTIADLQAAVEADEPLSVLLDRAAAFLADAEAVASGAGNAEALFATVAAEWAALEAGTRQAWVRFPKFVVSGAHGNEPDPRAIQLFSTITYLSKAGCYTPAELAQRRDDAEGGAAWAFREAIRLRVLIALLGSPMRALTDEALSPAHYAQAVQQLVQDVGRLPIAAMGHPKP